MAQYTLYVDTTSNRLIGGLATAASVAPASIPFFYGDTLQLQVYLMNKLQTVFPSDYPYIIIPTPGLQLFLYLDDGLVGGTIYTQQISWAPDPANQFFSANLALNTAAIQALLGAKTSGTCWIKIGYVQNGLQTTVYSQQVNINVGLPTMNLVVPPGLNPLSVEVAAATYFPQQPVAGMPFYLKSPNGHVMMLQAVDNPDGSVSAGWTQIS